MTHGCLTRGFSDAARFIDKMTWEERQYLNASNVFGIERIVRDELATVWEECRVPNWDGFQAMPVEQETLHNAYLFLESLPFGFPSPSVGAEPDGHLTLEWHRTARRTLSVSVDPDGVLHFAALFGPNRVYGTEAFFGEVPENILSLIQRLYAV